MGTVIDLMRPVSSERQPFGRPTIFIYKCSEGHTVRVRAGGRSGKRWTTVPGGIYCPQCPEKKE